VTTALGKGSTFRVYLPVIAETKESQERIGAVPRGNGELIVVADDDERVRTLTSDLLAANGYRVHSVCDGAEAAEVVQQRGASVSAIVTDLHMPRLGGVELVRETRRLQPQIRVLIMSGSSRETDLAPSQNPVEISDAFLLKPFKPDALLRAVHRILQS
jgi:two-component system, cell cycle sensor histidine kinase and response regulator CckA